MKKKICLVVADYYPKISYNLINGATKILKLLDINYKDLKFLNNDLINIHDSWNTILESIKQVFSIESFDNITVSGNQVAGSGDCPYCWFYALIEVVNSVVWEEIYNYDSQFIFTFLSFFTGLLWLVVLWIWFNLSIEK